MIEHVVPVLVALFLWWFATGVIVYVDGLPQRTFSWTFAAGTLALALALVALPITADGDGLWATYGAFACGLVIWAWLELAYYTGYLTGPRRTPCPEGATETQRFGYAIETVLWNLLGCVIAAAIIAAIVLDRANQIALWTFLVLFWMQQSAKLNVFFGVRNLNEEFLPAHLGYLKSYMRKAPMNGFFPVSVTASTVVCVLIIQSAHAPATTAAEAAGLALIATLLALAILEHWFLVLPIPAAKLWKWSLATHGRDNVDAPKTDKCPPAKPTARHDFRLNSDDFDFHHGRPDRNQSQCHEITFGTEQGARAPASATAALPLATRRVSGCVQRPSGTPAWRSLVSKAVGVKET